MNYRICSNCVMDNVNDPLITFNEQGICNHCITYNAVINRKIFPPEERKKQLEIFINKIKSKRKGKYDCVIGLSGGTDSSYVAYLTKQWGLSPLAVHFDNGWNSELSVQNIENILDGLDIDLYTYVVDWQEFRDLQRSYIIASVVDIEAITDHAITAVMHKVAKKFNIKYILSGSSIVTEGILPTHWIHNKADMINIKDIHNKHGKVKLKTFPFLGVVSKWIYRKLYNIQSYRVLDFVSYNKANAQRILKDELNWRDYGGKHYESIFTKFYQGFILPEKFNIDKRRSHFSTLICAGQMDRSTALLELEKPPYNYNELIIDKKFVLKKLGFSKEEFDQLMSMPTKSHLEYRSVMKIFMLGSKIKYKIKYLYRYFIYDKHYTGKNISKYFPFFYHFAKSLQLKLRLTFGKKNDLKIVLGSGGLYQKGWIPTSIETIDVANEKTWKRYLKEGSVSVFLAEHIWEHLTHDEADRAAMLCYKFLKNGGYCRIAVPDGYHPDEEYINAVGPTGPNEEHKILYNYKTLQELFISCGFNVNLLEYYDENKVFNSVEWDPEMGLINRSIRFRGKNKNASILGLSNYTSLIIDAYKNE